jgi:hypothetical protein
VRSKPDRLSGVSIYIEAGAKRVFASAVDWPGWSRGGRTEADAIAALVAYGARYAAVAALGRVKFTPPKDESELTVVKRLKGGSGTDFGVPSLGLATDSAPVTPAEIDRIAHLLEASWVALDRAAKSAKGLELQKGPRGGGRDLDKIVAHVNEADQGYIIQLGARPPKPAPGAALRPADLRDAIIAALHAKARGRPVANPSRATKPWTPRYFARRAAWHVLDHAWEIEDRAIRK